MDKNPEQPHVRLCGQNLSEAYYILKNFVCRKKRPKDSPVGYCKACHRVVWESNRVDDVKDGCTYVYECDCGYPNNQYDLGELPSVNVL